jgi:plasmid stabilization system protein ParE
MKLRLTPRALQEAKRVKSWWLQHRPAAPDLFEQEFNAAVAQIVTAPELGAPYVDTAFDVPVRRVLLLRTKNHLYYAANPDEIVILSVWGSQRRRGPKL